jgi:hypothetical protein
LNASRLWQLGSRGSLAADLRRSCIPLPERASRRRRRPAGRRHEPGRMERLQSAARRQAPVRSAAACSRSLSSRNPLAPGLCIATHPSVRLAEAGARFRHVGGLRRTLEINGKDAPSVRMRHRHRPPTGPHERFLRKRSSESGRQLEPLACGIAQSEARGLAGAHDRIGRSAGARVDESYGNIGIVPVGPDRRGGARSDSPRRSSRTTGRVALAPGANRSPRPASSQRGSTRVPGPGAREPRGGGWRCVSTRR